jgi:hypothetical protein
MSRQVLTILISTPARYRFIARLGANGSKSNSLQCHWAGAGADSLAIGHDSIWLTDYLGNISRLALKHVLAHCDPRR